MPYANQNLSSAQLENVWLIVLSWNQRELLRQTLQSLLAMSPGGFQVLVVDNASEDGSASMVEESFPEVRCLRNAENLGFGAGNNAGIRVAMEEGAEWVVLLNNDIRVAPDMLQSLLSAAAADPAIGAAGPKIYHDDEPKKIWFAGGRVNFWTGMLSHDGLRKLDTGQFDNAKDVGYLTGCVFLVRTSVLRQVGLFDPAYAPSYVEDADLSLRIREAGYRLHYVPGAHVWHKISASSGGGMTALKTKLKVAHNLLFFKRYASWYHWFTMPVFILMGTIAYVLYFGIQGKFSLIRALLDGYALGLRKAMGDRAASKTKVPVHAS